MLLRSGWDTRTGSPAIVKANHCVVTPPAVEAVEWFLVPLFVIDEAIERIRDGSITGCVYDPTAARLIVGPST